MKWKDPPGSSWGLADEAAELRRDKARKQRERIANGKAVAFQPLGAFESTLRTAEDGSCELYARYIGKEGQYGESATGPVDRSGVGPEGGTDASPADG